MRKKFFTIIAILVGITLITPMILVSFGNIQSKGSIEQTEDRSTAIELSNMTGLTADEILEIKNTGKTWNEVIEILKEKNEESKDGINRFNNLLESDLGEDFINQLINEGYSEDDILQAKLIVERLLFQLNEILNMEGNYLSVTPTENINLSNEEEDLSAYRTIAENFDSENAIILVLDLKEDFGYMEAVLDEYLLSLQFNLKLDEYIKDKNKYLKAKEEIILNVTPDKIITLATIENKMLKILQQDNDQSRSNTLSTENNNTINGEININDPINEINAPNVQDVNPVNPADKIMDEIEIINPNN